MNTELERLVERGDLDELTRLVDRLCRQEGWDQLLELRDRCRAALQRGKQLWPVAAHVEYRVALEAPGRWVGLVLQPGAGRFSLGPLTEVAASTHDWEELGPHLQRGPMAAMAAHERVIRGDDLRHDSRIDRQVLELPLVLESWESEYPVATYGPDEAEFPSPALPALEPVRLPPSPDKHQDQEALRALRELASVWTAESNGRVEAVAVDGNAPAAVGALGPPRARLGEVSPSSALAHMAWAAASGGAHGRRRGMAAGRAAAWWVVSALAGLPDEEAFSAEGVGHAASRLRWFVWDAGEPQTGWSLHLAVEDPDSGRAWAVAGTDAAS